MTTFFWYQPADLQAEDYFSINGVAQTEQAARMELHRKISQIAQLISKKAIPWCGKVKGNMIVNGLMETRDEKGRKLSFLFIGRGLTWQEFRRKLEAECLSLGLVIDAPTQAMLLSPQKKFPWKSTIICAVLILITVVFIYWMLRGEAQSLAQ